jgi:transcriptional regulator
MYTPRHFEVSNTATLEKFIASYSFATLVTSTDDGPLASHLPLMLDRGEGEHGTLLGHMARPNSHSRHFDAPCPSLAIFHGPHAYVSPSWYVDHPAVPTWNYGAVHVYGHPRVIEDEARVVRLLDDLVDAHEPEDDAPWRSALPDEFRAKMQRGIVAFEMPIARIEGKFKLAQNRSREDQERALAELAARSDSASKELARFWSEVLASEERD